MIDTRELHIGAHVDVRIRDLIEHKRVRICRTNDDNEVCYKRANDKGLLSAYAYHLQPIPLTAELLTEIGFERTNHVCVWRKSFNHSLLTISTHHKGEWSCSLWREDCRAVLNVRYLHELENFVYMTLHKELIEE